MRLSVISRFPLYFPETLFQNFPADKVDKEEAYCKSQAYIQTQDLDNRECPFLCSVLQQVSI